MKTVVIACKTISLELQKVMAEESLDYSIIWVESGLHNTPKVLHSRLQEIFDNIKDSGRVILALGSCGRATCNLRTGDFETIMPRADDCISLLIGSLNARAAICAEAPTYFMSKGWIEGERNIWVEYKYSVNKYGEELARSIMDQMLGSYKRLGILDTGCIDINELTAQTERMAEDLRLKHVVIECSDDWIKCMLTGPWLESDFITIEPHSLITDIEML